jgi:hypothetical protein
LQNQWLTLVLYCSWQRRYRLFKVQLTFSNVR